MYLYNSELPYLLHKEVLISDTFLINPYAPDFVLISNLITRRYELTDGYLATDSDTTTGSSTYKFTATDGT
jgi:hypothetical protein